MSVEATTNVTTPIAPTVTPAVESAVTPAAAPKMEETGSIGAGPAQATPAEDQAKKLYIVA